MQPDIATGEPVYQFINRKLGFFVLQIPSEQMLNFIREIQQQFDKLSVRLVGKPATAEQGKS